MKLHASAIKKLIELYTNYGGFQNEDKLRQKLVELDFTPYERTTTANNEIILVMTEDYMRELHRKR